MKKGMIKLSVLYPNGEGKTFNMDYYINQHLPLVRRLLGDACKGAQVDSGISGLGADIPAPYVVCGHLFFETVSELQESVGTNLDQMVSDIPNFTNVQPKIQIAEVVL